MSSRSSQYRKFDRHDGTRYVHHIVADETPTTLVSVCGKRVLKYVNDIVPPKDYNEEDACPACDRALGRLA